MRKVKGRFIKHDINFLGYRKVFLTVAAVAMVACLAIVGFRGLNFGIEFVGGTSVAFHGTGDIFSAACAGAMVRGKGLPDALRLAADFTLACIQATQRDPNAPWYGVEFEKALHLLPGLLER